MYGLIWSFVSISRREIRLIPISALACRSDFFGLLPYASATVAKFCSVHTLGRPERGASATEPVSSNLSQSL